MHKERLVLAEGSDYLPTVRQTDYRSLPLKKRAKRLKKQRLVLAEGSDYLLPGAAT